MIVIRLIQLFLAGLVWRTANGFNYSILPFTSDSDTLSKLSSIYHMSETHFNGKPMDWYSNCTKSLSQYLPKILENLEVAENIRSLNLIVFNDRCESGLSFNNVALPYIEERSRFILGNAVDGESIDSPTCLGINNHIQDYVEHCHHHCSPQENCLARMNRVFDNQITCYGVALLGNVGFCKTDGIEKKDTTIKPESHTTMATTTTTTKKPQMCEESCYDNVICYQKRRHLQMISYNTASNKTKADTYGDFHLINDTNYDVSGILQDAKSKDDSCSCVSVVSYLMIGEIHVHFEGETKVMQCEVLNKCSVLFNIGGLTNYYHYYQNCIQWYYYYPSLIVVSSLSIALCLLSTRYLCFPCIKALFYCLLKPISILYHACRCGTEKTYNQKNVRYTSKGVQVRNSIAPNRTDMKVHRTWFFGSPILTVLISLFFLINSIDCCDVVLSTDSFTNICDQVNTKECSQIYTMELTILSKGQMICYFKDQNLNRIVVKEVLVDCIPQVEYYTPIYDVHKEIDSSCNDCSGFCNNKFLEKCICDSFTVWSLFYGCGGFTARKAMKIRLSAKSGYIGHYATTLKCVKYEPMVILETYIGNKLSTHELSLGSNSKMTNHSFYLTAVSQEIPHFDSVVKVLSERFMVDSNLRNSHLLGAFGAVQCPTMESAKTLSTDCKIDPNSIMMDWNSQTIFINGMDNIDYLRELKNAQSDNKDVIEVDSKFRYPTNGIFPIKVMIAMTGKPDSELFSDVDLDSLKLTISGKRLEKLQGVIIVSSTHQEGVVISIRCKGVSNVEISTRKEGNSTHSCTIFDSQMKVTSCVLTSYNKVKVITATVEAIDYDIHLVDVLPPSVFDDVSDESYSDRSLFMHLLIDHYLLFVICSLIIILYLIKVLMS